jgi:hypothetical protein
VPNPGKPIEVKRRNGNPGKRKLPPSSQLAAVPAIPSKAYELSVSDALDRVLDMGTPWLAETDMTIVSLLREAVEDYTELRADPRSSPNQVREAREQIASFLSRLGFDPTSRSKLGLAEVKAQSTLEKLRASRK